MCSVFGSYFIRFNVVFQIGSNFSFLSDSDKNERCFQLFSIDFQEIHIFDTGLWKLA